jgi:hypothetical protein
MLANREELDAILRTDFCAFAQMCFRHLNPDCQIASKRDPISRPIPTLGA